MTSRQRLLLVLKISGRVALLVGIGLLALGVIGVYDALHPPRIVPPGYTLVKENIEFRSVDLLTEDGVRLSAWYTPPDDERSGAVILLAHGYGDNRPEWVHAMFAKGGYGVLSWDARAHGESGGEISTLGYREVLDVKAALDFVLAQPEIKHVGAWGGSMGGATLIRATASLPQIEALVVDSSFSSLGEEVDFLAPYPFVNPLAKLLMTFVLDTDLYSASPLEKISEISPRPVYIIQGSADKVASPDSAEELYEAAGDPRFLWVEEGVRHLGTFEANPRRYERRVLRFFDEAFFGALALQFEGNRP
ncbi:MAG: alpha/beta hydrolase [Anaerolineales bacterium]|nr:alpha/beta hydrolase [Anaerolineales bacterium]